MRTASAEHAATALEGRQRVEQSGLGPGAEAGRADLSQGAAQLALGAREIAGAEERPRQLVAGLNAQRTIAPREAQGAQHVHDRVAVVALDLPRPAEAGLVLEPLRRGARLVAREQVDDAIGVAGQDQALGLVRGVGIELGFDEGGGGGQDVP